MAEHFELIVFGLLVAVAGLVLLSDVLEVPYPIFLVLGGLVLGFIPGVPEVKLAPELVLLRGLPAGRGIEHFGYTRVGGPGSGDSGYLPGLALPPADLAEYPPAGILPLGDSDVHAELAPVYTHRVTATNGSEGDLRGLLPDDVDALRSGRVPGSDRCSIRVDLPSYLPPPQGERRCSVSATPRPPGRTLQ